MAKNKAGQVGSRMTAAQKEAANAARLAKAAKQAAKQAAKKAAKQQEAEKVNFNYIQLKAIKLALWVGLTQGAQDTSWEVEVQKYFNTSEAVQKPRAGKRVAPSVKTKPVVKTITKADKFAPSANKAVDPIIDTVVDDSNKTLKDALKKVMYNTFYDQQKEAVADLIFARKSEIHAAYMNQYESYKAELKATISVVVDEFESIKAQVNQDLNAWANQEVQAYNSQLATDFEAAKPVLLQEVLDKAQLSIDVNVVASMMEQARAEKEAAKVAAAKELAQKKLAAIDAYNKASKIAATKSIADKDKSALAKAKKDLFYSTKLTTALACKAVINNSKEVAKLNKEQAQQYLELFRELQALVKQAQDAVGTKAFKDLLNKIYKVGGALSALFKSISNELGYSFNVALENILNNELQAINSIESVMSLSEKEKNNRRVIVDVLDKLEALS